MDLTYADELYDFFAGGGGGGGAPAPVQAVEDPLPAPVQQQASPAKSYAELKRRELDLKDEMKDIQASMNALKEPLIEYFAEEGIDRYSSAEHRITLYLRHDLTITGGGDTGALVAALAADPEYAEFVRPQYLPSALRAHIKERAEELGVARDSGEAIARAVLPEAIAERAAVKVITNIGAQRKG